MSDGAKIPYIITDTVEYLKQNGLGVEGLFRKCGNVERLKFLKKSYNEGKRVAFTNDEIHNVASLLKLFLRDLEEPLLTFELYDEIVSLQSKSLDLSDKVEVTRHLITQKLPSENFTVLEYLIEFLWLVAQNSEENKMTTRNISIVFGPNFLWAPVSNLNEFNLTHVEMINSFVELLVRFHQDIFSKKI